MLFTLILIGITSSCKSKRYTNAHVYFVQPHQYTMFYSNSGIIININIIMKNITFHLCLMYMPSESKKQK